MIGNPVDDLLGPPYRDKSLTNIRWYGDGGVEDVQTPEDMRQWLQQELRDLTKATELRVKDATDFVTAYALGKITAEEAADRLSRYQYRWGDSPIPGVATEENTPNDEILRRLDDGLPPTVKRLLEERERKHRRRER